MHNSIKVQRGGAAANDFHVECMCLLMAVRRTGHLHCYSLTQNAACTHPKGKLVASLLVRCSAVPSERSAGEVAADTHALSGVVKSVRSKVDVGSCSLSERQ